MIKENRPEAIIFVHLPISRQQLKIDKQDVSKLGLHFCMLQTPKQAEQKLGSLVEEINRFDPYIDQFPEVKAAPLEPLYELARGLGAFNIDFLKIQLFELGWRGIISGGLYALLKPNADFRTPLESVQPPQHEENMWSTNCALANLSSKKWPAECENLEGVINTIRSAIERLGIRNTSVRRSLNASELEEFETFKSQVRENYKRMGAQKALEIMATEKYYQWIAPYDTWLVKYANQENCVSLYKPSLENSK